MIGRILSLGGLMAAVVMASPATVSLDAQSSGPVAKGSASAAKTPAAAKGPSVKRTPWGDPDLQGTWDYRTITPLERPGNLGDRQFLTDEEAAQLETRAAKRLDEPPDDTVSATTVHAPYWTDAGRKVLDDKRTSLIVDPPDGRVPPLTPEAQRRLASRRLPGRDGGTDAAENRSLLERCITAGMPGAILPTLYNNNIQIVQGPGYVAIIHEMVHDTRIIPLDGRRHVGAGIRQWFGDSRGRWDGETLVVETTNFSDKTNYRGSGSNLRLTERFTRLDARTLGFQLTAEDPTTWTRSWTAAFPMRPSEGPLYEYACHEGNYGLRNILEEARGEEAAAAKK